MKSTITLHDLTFELFIRESEIQPKIKGLAKQMDQELKDKNPYFLVVLKGAMPFAVDLLKHLEAFAEVGVARVQSYVGTASGELVIKLLELPKDKKREIVIIEDIVDSGKTIDYLIQAIQEGGYASPKICTLFHKPQSNQSNVTPDWVGFEIPEKFIVGYGLDYNELGRNLRDVYVLSEEKE